MSKICNYSGKIQPFTTKLVHVNNILKEQWYDCNYLVLYLICLHKQ